MVNKCEIKSLSLDEGGLRRGGGGRAGEHPLKVDGFVPEIQHVNLRQGARTKVGYAEEAAVALAKIVSDPCQILPETAASGMRASARLAAIALYSPHPGDICYSLYDPLAIPLRPPVATPLRPPLQPPGGCCLGRGRVCAPRRHCPVPPHSNPLSLK